MNEHSQKALATESYQKLDSFVLASAHHDLVAAAFEALLKKLVYLNDEDIFKVQLAFHFSNQAHNGQLRNNGEPYITHPIAVALECAGWKLDAQAIMAALLHDSLEDCGVTKSELATRFGQSVAELVDGLTKLDKLQFHTREENQAESFRKMLLAMARDVRVILIKLADRSHNMRTLSDMPKSKWARISSETIEIYAPIAHRLGLNEVYRELQDLAFRHLNPWRYGVLTKAINKARHRKRDLIHKVQSDVADAFQRSHLSVQITGREKTLYSIYQKMRFKRLSFAQVTDMYGFRIVVPSVLDCYTALGLLHQVYKPVPGKFKDHIAIAKSNGYQSLHTTLVGPANINIEFQTRTEDMHIVAESGVAAHWLYKNPENDSVSLERSERLGNQWLQSLLAIQDETRDAAEFWDHVKVDLFPDAVYVFTPKGQIMAMPRGATVVDFAYAIHSDVGDRAIAGKINNEQIPLRTELKSGDIVEVVTAPVSSPNPAWLGFVRTGKARSRIRHYLKTLAHEESEKLGEKLLAQALRAQGIERLPSHHEALFHPLWDKILRFTSNKNYSELMLDIGLGRRIASIVAKRLATLLSESGTKPNALLLSNARFTAHETITQGAVILDGSESASVKYASCCRPIPGDEIIGYLGRGEGLTVHANLCSSIKRLKNKDSEHFIAVDWADEICRAFEANLVVTVSHRKGVLARIASELAVIEIDIVQVNMGEEGEMDTSDLHFLVSVRNAKQLDQAIKNLQRIPMVLKASRDWIHS